MKESLLKIITFIIALAGCLALLGYASPTCAGDISTGQILVAGTLLDQVQTRQTVKPSLPGAVQLQERTLPSYPDSGNGPLPNVGYWLPTGKNHQGGYLTIRGSNFVPGNTYAYVGGVKLLQGTIQTASEISFKVPDNLFTLEGKNLVVFIKGGQVLTLENSYKVYPRVSITSVVPTTFKQGTRVTIRGTSFPATNLQAKYTPNKVTISQTVYESSMLSGDFIIIDIDNQLANAKYALITNPVISANGDTFEFTVGALYEHIPVNYCAGSAGCFPASQLSPMSPLPVTVPGTLKLYTCGGTYVMGPSVKWLP